MNVARIALAVIFMVTSVQALAGPVQTSVISFTKSPDRAIRVERTENGRIFFFECADGAAADGATLSNCTSIGRQSGYTTEQIDRRGRTLRALKWAKNIAIVPTVSVCGAALAGALGAEYFIQSLANINAANDPGNAIAAVDDSFLLMVMIPVAFVIYGTAGAGAGFVASLAVSHFTMPNLKAGSTAMLFASRKVDVPNITIKGDIANYRQAIERALAGIPDEVPAI